MGRARPRLLAIVTLLVLASIAAARYILLSREATSSLATFFSNGLCLAGRSGEVSCYIYLKTEKELLHNITIVVGGHNYTYKVPAPGVYIDKSLQLWLTGGPSRANLNIVVDGRTRLETVVENASFSVPCRMKASHIREREYTLAAGEGATYELGLRPTLSKCYAAIIEADRGCVLDARLYAFQDLMAWEVIEEAAGPTRIIVPIGGALGGRGYGPLYTKLVVNSLEGRCHVKASIVETPNVIIVLGLERGGNVVVSVPLLAG